MLLNSEVIFHRGEVKEKNVFVKNLINDNNNNNNITDRNNNNNNNINFLHITIIVIITKMFFIKLVTVHLIFLTIILVIL